MRPENPLTHALEEIDARLQAGDAQAAEPVAQGFVARNPGNVDGWILLGRACLDLLKFDKALEIGRKVVEMAPGHAVARLLLINALLRGGHSDDAFAQAAELEAQKKYDPVVSMAIGTLYTQTNRHADAARCYERVRVLQPADSKIVYNLASAYIALGDLDRAEALFGELIRKDPHGLQRLLQPFDAAQTDRR